ncbi:MAG: M56 family metallopeptidase [Acidobacteria bacterium]|nr:M56 family metallopeptidase [Acidobacteriota bacterium]
MSRTIELAASFLANAAWQIAAVALAAALCARILRDAPARLRHVIWVAALTLSFALPLAGAFAPTDASAPRDVALPSSLDAANERLNVSAGEARNPSLDADAGTRGDESHAATAATGGFNFARLLRRRTKLIVGSPALAAAFVTCYAIFLLFHFAALARAWRRTRRLRRSATSSALPASVAPTTERCRSAFGLRRVAFACSREARAPATLGTFAPLVVLPEKFCEEGVSAETLASVVGHELAHVARRDFALNLAYEILLLPVSFHPLARFCKRQVDRTRELACDELVAERLLAPDVYARSLVRAAGAIAATPTRALTLGVFDADILEERIMRLTEHTRRLSPRSARSLALASVALLSLSCLAISSFSFQIGTDTAPRLGDARPSTTDPVIGETRENVAQERRQEPPAREERERGDALQRGEIAQSLSSGDAQTRAHAACEAGHKRAVDLIPALASMLGDDAPVPLERCWGEGRWSPALDSFKQPSPGEQAAIALASMGTPALEPLTRALDDGSAGVRRNAAWAIGELTNMRESDRAPAVPRLIELLSDSDELVRSAAVQALAEVRDERSVAPLIGALSDSQPGVRQRAAWALGELKAGRAVEALGGLLVSDSQAEVRQRAARALGEIQSRKALPFLKQARSDAEPRVREAVRWALSEIEGDDGDSQP